MPPIIFEGEYNPRVSVPDYSEIFARLTREADDYRAETLKHGMAELGLSYGSTRVSSSISSFPRWERRRRSSCSSLRVTGAR
jgi:hypothetical protein